MSGDVEPGDGVAAKGDTLTRCTWADTDPLLREYHDAEWGRPVRGERALFERLTLEGFQAGLSWLTILRKRPAFREVFAGFDVEEVARFDEARIAELMDDARIVRNRAKIDATIGNARAIIELRDQGGLEGLLASQPVGVVIPPRTMAEVPTRTAESTALAATLRRHGIRFIGPTSAFALMEAIGMVDTHLVGCHLRGLVADSTDR